MLTQKEEEILASIVVASENDPNKPEFPPENPSFPATPTYKINVAGFSNIWIKDESHNVTGTHKDRMAWEIIVTYREFLLAKKSGQTTRELQAMSIISSGSAAIAIQKQLRNYKLPNLKVLVDKSINSEILKNIEDIGCEIYKTDLSKKALSSNEILEMTDNLEGVDITSSKALNPTTNFYDWLSYEILNSSPDFCFIPFGTGHLFENILNINRKEVSSNLQDPRFFGDKDVLKNCNFMGATTNMANSKAIKLYSPHLPFVNFDEQWIKLYRHAGFCGQKSNVFLIEEEFLDQALEIAKENNIKCEPSGISGLALLLQMKNEIPRNKKILIINTGKSKI